MIGKEQLIIDASEFLKGVSSGAEISDGGFSPTGARGFNMLKTPGVLYAPPQAADVDTDNTLTSNGEIVATSPDHAVFSGDNRLCVAAKSNGDGTFYRYNGTKLVLADDANTPDITNNYAKFFTDIINFAGETYVTSKETIVRWTSTATFNISFYTFAAHSSSAISPHPAIVFENNAFYGDVNVLLRQTAAAGAPAAILTLSVDQVITGLGVDQGSGKMLIATSSSLNISNTLTAVHKLLWYDGFSNKVIKSVIIDDMITGFYSHGGITYVAYGGIYLGYINGSGISFLRKLKNATFDSDVFPTKHSFTHRGNTVMVIDGSEILFFGEVIRGSKIFYYGYKNYITGGAVSTTAFKCICPLNSSTTPQAIGISVATENFFSLDISSVATIDSFTLISNFYQFPRPVYLRRLELQFIDNISSGVIVVTYQDERRNGLTLGTEWGTLTNQKIHGYVGFGGDDSSDSNKVTQFQLTLAYNTTNAGLKRVILYYDPAE